MFEQTINYYSYMQGCLSVMPQNSRTFPGHKLLSGTFV